MMLFCFLMLHAMNDGFRYLNSNFIAFRIFEKLENLNFINEDLKMQLT